ncbi:MAG: hypothetical protein COX55_03370 [Zetaproteobacteria bacterium CG23_combo_of_CG06-09_8_20_14_all_54_7]|nr:MAG: hypothetical protein COX55_03370 [Zetaproteobacteria bacterium CG23_combo_of_CG06-09_8_20_14_all_54_7]
MFRQVPVTVPCGAVKLQAVPLFLPLQAENDSVGGRPPIGSANADELTTAVVKIIMESNR